MGTHVHGLTEIVALTLWDDGTSEALTLIRGFDLDHQCIQGPFIFQVVLILNKKNSFMPIQCFSKGNRFVDLLHFLWEKILLRAESTQTSTDHSSTLGEEPRIVSWSHSLFSGLPNQNRAALALQDIPFFFQHTIKTMWPWHTEASEGKLWKALVNF